MSLELKKVRHRYEAERWILTDIDLSVGRNESLALMGPSGSGKTTLLTILGLLQAPTGGSVVLNGTPVGPGDRTAPEYKNTFGWVFQTVNTIGSRSALDNVAISLLGLGFTRNRAHEKARTVLEAVGMGSFCRTPLNRLSGGEVQRVCIARALVSAPMFLLADEPTGQLDRDTTTRVLDALWKGRTAETSIVIATHDPQVADRCDRVLHLANERLTAR